MSSWQELSAELDLWADAGEVATFWWRDDDAIEPTPALDRLLALRQETGVPVAIAVIPANAQPELGDVVADENVDILQHGYAHRNHREKPAKKAELGGDRALWDIAGELAAGRGRMFDIFGEDGWVEAMVPPWNRIDDAVTALLPGLGFHGISTFNARVSAEPVQGLTAVNTHIEIIDWRGGRNYAGDGATLSAAIAHLADKRTGAADRDEATGLLTHHLAHDDGCWAFIRAFIDATAGHPAVRWISARTLFPVPA
ncbi:MAG: polysaccharide deacetylase family protein [Alphaproteobacteria bacterium]